MEGDLADPRDGLRDHPALPQPTRAADTMIGVVTLIPTESQLNLSHPSPLIAVSTQPSRATTVWLAINPVARRVIALQAAMLALTAPLYPLVGISIRWSTALPRAFLFSFMVGV